MGWQRIHQRLRRAQRDEEMEQRPWMLLLYRLLMMMMSSSSYALRSNYTIVYVQYCWSFEGEESTSGHGLQLVKGFSSLHSSQKCFSNLPCHISLIHSGTTCQLITRAYNALITYLNYLTPRHNPKYNRMRRKAYKFISSLIIIFHSVNHRMSSIDFKAQVN